MHSFSIPITDPVLIFTIILFIVLLVPVFLRKTNIPSIVGLIVVGVVIGPYGTHIIGENDVIELFGKVGLLYIMFLAGLEIEFIEFKKNSKKGIFYGISTFVIPFFTGFFTAQYLFALEILPSVLIGALLASHTLIAFPTTTKLGIAKSLAVNIAISGTVIADTLVLFILAFVTALLNEGSNNSFILIFLFSFGVFSFIMFFFLPKLSRWFFKTITTDGNLQYLFTLTVLFASSFFAEIIGAEPIIGAFFAGLAMNRLIPSTSTLMNRIEFVGNTLFIPVFLISVGMLVNLKVLFTGVWPLIYALMLAFVAIGSKWLAAFFTKLIFKLTKNETNTIFGLSTARAAATLAVALVGFDYNVLSKDIFNATILLIMITSLFSSYVTEIAGKKLAIEENEKLPEQETNSIDRILVPIAKPENIEKLIDLAILIKKPNSREPILPLAVVKDDEEASQRILATKPLIDKVAQHASGSGITVNGITRVDVNIPNAIVKASKELTTSEIVMGWSGKTAEFGKIFGNMLETILDGAHCTVIVAYLQQPLNTNTKINIAVPDNAELETGFSNWVNIISRLNNQLSAETTIYSSDILVENLKRSIKKINKKLTINYQQLNNSQSVFDDFAAENTLHVIINARPQTVSYNSKFWNVTFGIPENLMNDNVLVIYPHQYD